MSWFLFIYIISAVYYPPDEKLINTNSAHCKAKGQLISEQIYAVLNFPKMQLNIARISALASKMGQIKQVNAHYHSN